MRVLIIFALVVLAGAATAQPSNHDPIVGMYTSYSDRINCTDSPYVFAITASGEWFYYHPVGPVGEAEWTYEGNLWELAETPPLDPFVAIGRYESTSTNLIAITGRGDVVRRTTEGWVYEGQIGDLAGRPQDGQFVDIVKASSPMAITDSGELYRRNPIGEWEYMRSIEEDTGVIGTEPSSLGDLKSMFR